MKKSLILPDFELTMPVDRFMDARNKDCLKRTQCKQLDSGLFVLMKDEARRVFEKSQRDPVIHKEFAEIETEIPLDLVCKYNRK